MLGLDMCWPMIFSFVGDEPIIELHHQKTITVGITCEGAPSCQNQYRLRVAQARLSGRMPVRSISVDWPFKPMKRRLHRSVWPRPVANRAIISVSYFIALDALMWAHYGPRNISRMLLKEFPRHGWLDVT